MSQDYGSDHSKDLADSSRYLPTKLELVARGMIFLHDSQIYSQKIYTKCWVIELAMTFTLILYKNSLINELRSLFTNL